MRSCSNKLHAGFTLLELLVAVTVFAVMSAMAYGGLRNVIDNSEASEAAMQRLQDVQTTIASISRDLGQVFERDILDAYGVRQAYLLADVQSDFDIEFTRSGRRNPAGLPRSSLQRVAWYTEEGKLYRVLWANLDRAQGEEPLRAEMIDGVSALDFRFMDQQGEWEDNWPPPGAGLPGTPTMRLRAIEMTLTLEDWGKLTRLYEVSL